jgi:hypothetical protein
MAATAAMRPMTVAPTTTARLTRGLNGFGVTYAVNTAADAPAITINAVASRNGRGHPDQIQPRQVRKSRLGPPRPSHAAVAAWPVAVQQERP